MKVLLINGSPRKNGNTYFALSEIANTLKNCDVESEIISIGVKAVQGCIACNKCNVSKRCIFKDDLYNTIRESLKNADALIIGSPVYFAGPSGSLCAVLDRVFYSCAELLKYKLGASVVVCRRGGASAAFDRLNKYFSISNMPLVPSQYWNSVHGFMLGEVSKDAEGLQTMRTLGNNMVWMLKNMKNNVENIPKIEERILTNFIR